MPVKPAKVGLYNCLTRDRVGFIAAGGQDVDVTDVTWLWTTRDFMYPVEAIDGSDFVEYVLLTFGVGSDEESFTGFLENTFIVFKTHEQMMTMQESMQEQIPALALLFKEMAISVVKFQETKSTTKRRPRKKNRKQKATEAAAAEDANAAAAEDRNQCPICLNNEITHICVPCGHFCLCTDCAKIIKHRCPICRVDLENIIRVYSVAPE